MSNKRAGFTLVEMVLIVFIIGLLAALLMPAVWQARQRGGETNCISNMHQLLQALELYRQDFGGTPTDIPPKGILGIMRGDYEDSEHILHIATLEGRPLGPYVTQDSLFQCPMAPPELRKPGRRTYTLASAIDFIRENDPQIAAESPSFAEAYQLRGDDTPVLLCRVHMVYFGKPFVLVGRADGRVERVAAPGRYQHILGNFFGW